MAHNYRVIEGIEPSYAERYISTYLDTRKIVYVQEVEFESCFNPATKRKLRFDFYLADLNILIEYDGNKFHKTKEVLNRDNIKTEFAKTSSIRLLRLRGELNMQLLKSLDRFIIDKAPVTIVKNYKPKEKKKIKGGGNRSKKALDYIFTTSKGFKLLNAHDKAIVTKREKQSYAAYKRDHSRY